MNSKFSFLSIIVIICVLAVGTVSLIYFISGGDSELKTVEQKNTEAERLKQINSDAIVQASSSSSYLRNINESDHIIGSLDAPVQIIIYTDFGCPFCARFYKVTKRIEEQFGDRVVIAIRHYPLTSHYNSVDLAMASECANEQGKFWEMYDTFFETKNLDTEKAEVIAKDLSLDFVEYKKCLESDKYKDFVYGQKAEGKSAGATGTPTIFVDSEIFSGAVPFDDYVDSSGKTREGMKSIIIRHLEN